jgi:hypothetical protein
MELPTQSVEDGIPTQERGNEIRGDQTQDIIVFGETVAGRKGTF